MPNSPEPEDARAFVKNESDIKEAESFLAEKVERLGDLGKAMSAEWQEQKRIEDDGGQPFWGRFNDMRTEFDTTELDVRGRIDMLHMSLETNRELSSQIAPSFLKPTEYTLLNELKIQLIRLTSEYESIPRRR